MTKPKESFKVLNFEVVTKSKGNGSVWESYCEAKVKVDVRGRIKYEVAEGSGPLNALTSALRKALCDFNYLERVKLYDYRVEMVKGDEDTASSVRVYVEFTDGENKWQCGSMSKDVINASFHAIVEGLSLAISKSLAAA